MALQFFTSNKLIGLAEELARQESMRQRTVFEQQVIITQVAGMNAWLTDRLAFNLGIAANISFLTPNRLLNKIFFALGGSFQEPLNENSVIWIIYHVLGTPAFYKKFKSISNYYTESSGLNSMKQFNLAEKVSDLFDQYQIYRPAMIKEWSATSLDECNDWQQYLWQATKQIEGDRMPDKTRMGEFILNELKSADSARLLKERVPDISLFGLSVITHFHIQIIIELSKHIDVTFYLLNPSPEYLWVDEKSAKQIAKSNKKFRENFIEGNELIGELGKVQRDTFKMLYEHEDVLNAYEVTGIEEPDPKTLLGQIQYDIYHSLSNDNREDIKQAKLRDGSILIQSNYTEAREVESVYNFIIQSIMEKPGKVNLNEIIVLLTDVNKYEPYIRAVFDNAPYKLAYHISDTGYENKDSYLSAFRKLLELSEENITGEKVLDLLNSTYIRSKTKIEDTQTLRELVAAAGIHFGIENETANETFLVSWSYGLERIIYGLVMQGEPLVETRKYPDGFFPVDKVEGMAMDQVVSFCAFVKQLISNLRQRQQKRTMKDWSVFLLETADTFLASPGNDNLGEQESFNALLSSVQQTSDYVEDKYPFQIVSYSLISNLSDITEANQTSGRGITFCSFIPMRSIPFKYVCVLGLNNNVFPRIDSALTFDKIKAEPKTGDRSTKENDKNLFFETLLSAGEKLYISYIGRNAEDNTTIPASSVVDILLGYISIKLKEETDLYKEFVVQQPLHSYSRQFNQQGGKLWNYLIQNKSASAVEYLTESENTQDRNLDRLLLKDLIDFFQNSIKFYFNRSASVYYSTEDFSEIPEHELFDLNSLQNSQIMKELILSNAELGGYIKTEKLKGSIPLAAYGTSLVTHIAEEVAGKKLLFEELSEGFSCNSYTATITVSGLEIEGSVSDIYGKNLIKVIASTSTSNNHLNRLYITYLFHILAGNEGAKAYLINAQNGLTQLLELDQADALARFQELLKFFPMKEIKKEPYAASFQGSFENFDKFMEAVHKAARYDEYLSLVINEDYFTEEKFHRYREFANLFLNIIKVEDND